MKFSNMKTKHSNELYEEARYNPNTTGKHIVIKSGKSSIIKRTCATGAIFELSDYNDRYNQAVQELGNNEPSKVLDKMYELAENNIKEYTQNDGKLLN